MTRITSDRFLEYHESIGTWFYIGPFIEGINLVAQTEEVKVELTKGGWMIHSDFAFGFAQIQEVAWRYYLGAAFGPIDDAYDANDLAEALALAPSLGAKQEVGQ